MSHRPHPRQTQLSRQLGLQIIRLTNPIRWAVYDNGYKWSTRHTRRQALQEELELIRIIIRNAMQPVSEYDV